VLTNLRHTPALNQLAFPLSARGALLTTTLQSGHEHLVNIVLLDVDCFLMHAGAARLQALHVLGLCHECQSLRSTV